MKIQIKATHISLTPEITSYLEKKLAMLEKFVQGHEEVLLASEIGKSTEHHKSGDVFRAEFNLYLRGGSLRAVAEASDLYSAIDQAKDELLSELKTHKSKKRDIFRKSALKLKNLLKGLAGRA